MSQTTPAVFVVDDDKSVRRGLERLLRSAGYAVESFASAAAFLESGQRDHDAACLVLDLSMPGLNGTDLQSRLRLLRSPLAIVFISGHGDIPTTVRAIREGAVDFLPKPFADDQLLEAVARAIARTRQESRSLQVLRELQQRLATVSEREREVLVKIVTGKPNKQVADELGIAEKTIKIHRARILAKMQVASVTELVPLAAKLGLLASS